MSSENIQEAKHLIKDTYSQEMFIFVCFVGLLAGFYGIYTFVGYLMSNQCFYKKSVLFKLFS